ncbi:MAG: tRNA (N(6)-L-threonylcarbamoyladenosine(37)-C(2))-methylthiotransferase MtaB [Syntrophales bacterium]|jgi:threonylcarbamoyladenosine tRNA methylthiotransferase MtaB|nr:tRNA (N(6)-L-threonylcarbamoyladenosine(37)-C(2))-methylthiotransferase MtaB [Syntrophales bacterium]
MKKRVAIATLGCKVNQADSAAIAEAIEGRGFSLVPFDQEADIYIVNTCTVTARTDYQSRQLVRRAARLNPAAAVVVTGCYAQVAPESLRGLPGVVLVAGTAEKNRIPEMIAGLDLTRPGGVFVGDLSSARTFARPGAIRFAGHTRAFLKVQEGCDARCRYCIVPRARGPSRSLPLPEALARLKELGEAGYRETVLTGIHLGAYGRDLEPPTNLPLLLAAAEQQGGIERLRLSSVEPREVTEDLIALMRRSRLICRHLHIPLQSGDDEILRRMGRDYDAAFYGALLSAVAAAVPDIALGADVMAGFPGETPAQFAGTCEFLRESPLAYLHVFPYSDRPGTEASRMDGKVDAAEKKRRAQILREIGQQKRRAFAERFLGRELSVLIEERNAGGQVRGFSGNYIPVVLRHEGLDLTNRIVRVRIESFREEKLHGIIARE